VGKHGRSMALLYTSASISVRLRCVSSDDSRNRLPRYTCQERSNMRTVKKQKVRAVQADPTIIFRLT
jgi:hypothetical protein